MRFEKFIQAPGVVQLDIKDKRILYLLCMDSRSSCSTIAKSAGVSKDAVNYRIKRLEQIGVIQGYITVVNTACLGHDSYHLFLQLNNLNEEVRAKFTEICKYPCVKAVLEYSGKFNYEIAISAKSVLDFDGKVTKIIDNLASYIQAYEILVIARTFESRALPSGFFPFKVDWRTSEPCSLVKADDMDFSILRVISNYARIPLMELGMRVGLTAEGVKYRLRKLQASGIIVKYMPIMNYSALGYTMYGVLMSVRGLTSEKERKLDYFLKTNEHVLWAVKTVGQYNLMMYICTKTSEEFHDTILTLRNQFDILDYEALIAREELKYTYFPEACASR